MSTKPGFRSPPPRGCGVGVVPSFSRAGVLTALIADNDLELMELFGGNAVPYSSGLWTAR